MGGRRGEGLDLGVVYFSLRDCRLTKVDVQALLEVSVCVQWGRGGGGGYSQWRVSFGSPCWQGPTVSELQELLNLSRNDVDSEIILSPPSFFQSSFQALLKFFIIIIITTAWSE